MKKYLIGAGVIVGIVAIVFVLLHHGTKPSTAVHPPTKHYVAMGDSVAAGVGLQTASDPSACDRTNESYPNQVAAKLTYKLQNIACSGATLSSGILGNQDVNGLSVAPQIQQMFAGSKPDLATLTVGANDAHWTAILTECYKAECSEASDAPAVTAGLATVSDGLKSALSQVQSKYPVSPPHIIVTSYYQVFPATAPSNACVNLTGIDASEISWVRQLQTKLNDTIKQAVSGYSFAAFVPVDFSGHELCTSDPWVQGLGDKQPFHPTQAGQAAFAKAVEAFLGTTK